MKILFDHQIFETQSFGGISRYFYELLSNFQKDEHVEWDLPILYSNNVYLKSLPFFEGKLLAASKSIDYFENFLWGFNFKGKGLLYKLKGEKKQPFSKEYQVNKERSIERLKEGNFDIFHPTYYDNYFLEYIGYKPFVLTVYDLIHQVFPEFGLYETRDKNKAMIEKANMIIAISESTKSDLVSIFNIDPNKIFVTHLGNSLKDEGYTVSESFTNKIPKKYLLYVGGRDNYKNFLFFIQVVAATVDDDIYVVCTGSPFNNAEYYLFNKVGFTDRVFHTYVTDNELVWLYKNAIAFVFPSMYEGFGLPVLEAFSCGCPVLVSNTSSLSEIGEDAVIYFEPKNSASMSKAIRTIIHSKDVREEKISKGYQQLKRFSWQRSSELTKNVYEHILHRVENRHN